MAGYHYVPFGHYQCQNCDNEFDGIVCNVCGQHPVQKKLTVKVLKNEFVARRKYDFKVLWKTMLGLILRPGKVIHEYLDGKRHTWYNGVNFFLLAGTLAAFVTLQFSSFDSAEGVKAIKEAWASMGVQESQMGNDFLIKYRAWIQAHYNILLLFALPFAILLYHYFFKI